DRFMAAVRTSASALWHRVLFAPYDVASEQPSRVTHSDYHPLRERQEVAIRQPRGLLLDKGLPLCPRFHVSGIVFRKSVLVGPEGTVVTVIQPPVHWRVISVADVDPYQAVLLDFRLERVEYVDDARYIVARILFYAYSCGHALTPVRR